ncbi:MAG TPA: HAD-IC family P-type ATPase, partial [Acidimicrobiales bacterium]|nr:HAD-IC family P-type ATPase [Acidimicrobiales bacterium]
TALAVAGEIGLGARLAAVEDLRARRGGDIDFDVAAGVLPADKLALVERGQRAGHVVGMTGDGVNDAPALKRAEVGIAVSSATDVAKEAASLVLTGEGLSNVVAAVETGRRVYQRMLTYTLNKIAKTFQVSLFLGLGLLATGTFVTTPRLVLLLLFANDFVTMSLATDRVGFSPRPDRWRVPSLSLAALGVALPWLVVSFATYFVGRHALHLGLAETQTLVFVMLVATGQATVYLVRERGHLWSSRPSAWMLAATLTDLVLVTVLATRGILMAAVPVLDVVVVFASLLAITVALDYLKGPLLTSVRTE